jgi:hypothetical protein
MPLFEFPIVVLRCKEEYRDLLRDSPSFAPYIHPLPIVVGFSCLLSCFRARCESKLVSSKTRISSTGMHCAPISIASITLLCFAIGDRMGESKKLDRDRGAIAAVL